MTVFDRLMYGSCNPLSDRGGSTYDPESSRLTNSESRLLRASYEKNTTDGYGPWTGFIVNGRKNPKVYDSVTGRTQGLEAALGAASLAIWPTFVYKVYIPEPECRGQCTEGEWGDLLRDPKIITMQDIFVAKDAVGVETGVLGGEKQIQDYAEVRVAYTDFNGMYLPKIVEVVNKEPFPEGTNGSSGAGGGGSAREGFRAGESERYEQLEAAQTEGHTDDDNYFLTDQHYVPGARKSSGYGWRTQPAGPSRGTRKFHGGIDLSAPTGTQILCAGKGVVSMVKANSASAGNYVEVYHGVINGQKTHSRYLHMKWHKANNWALSATPAIPRAHTFILNTA